MTAQSYFSVRTAELAFHCCEWRAITLNGAQLQLMSELSIEAACIPHVCSQAIQATLEHIRWTINGKAWTGRREGAGESRLERVDLSCKSTCQILSPIFQSAPAPSSPLTHSSKIADVGPRR